MGWMSWRAGRLERRDSAIAALLPNSPFGPPAAKIADGCF